VCVCVCVCVTGFVSAVPVSNEVTKNKEQYQQRQWCTGQNISASG
jgi:dolichyl-phosphate-mannose--protein O-mannosyl transferase